jgi:hypothetical protein
MLWTLDFLFGMASEYSGGSKKIKYLFIEI